MAKGKKIKAVNPHSSFHWSELLDPADVTAAGLPAKAGIYMVVACDAGGVPIKLPGSPATTRMPGVVYIGLTGRNNTLKKRFSEVARAWRVNHKWANPPHGSRKHYDGDPKAKKLFKVKDVRIRFAPLPTDPKQDRPEVSGYAAKQGMTSSELRNGFGLQLTGDHLVADSEAMAIQQFKRQLGYIPILNRREEGRGDAPPTAKELADFLRKS